MSKNKSIELTEQEIIILKNVRDKYTYIARDENCDLNLFEQKPNKYYFEGGRYEKYHYYDYEDYNPRGDFNLYREIFESITFGNSPLLIEELIKEKNNE